MCIRNLDGMVSHDELKHFAIAYTMRKYHLEYKTIFANPRTIVTIEQHIICCQIIMKHANAHNMVNF